mmetsp:Transcript_36284/g.93550  ORF Transcript_36284/g.93550 Transcript_36284/m.93550 type:complete len:203 (+) Transcript_36284:817-1425(+)
MMRSPARAWMSLGLMAPAPSSIGSPRGMTKKSWRRFVGQRWNNSACCWCEPGSKAKPPVDSSWSYRVTRPCAQTKLLPVEQPFWSQWNHPPRVRQAGFSAGGRKAPQPSKLTSSSPMSSRPHTSANARITRVRVRTNHMKADCPTPPQPVMPLDAWPSHSREPQDLMLSRRTFPCVAASYQSQKSPRALSTSSSSNTEANTT